MKLFSNLQWRVRNAEKYGYVANILEGNDRTFAKMPRIRNVSFFPNIHIGKLHTVFSAPPFMFLTGYQGTTTQIPVVIRLHACESGSGINRPSVGLESEVAPLLAKQARAARGRCRPPTSPLFDPVTPRTLPRFPSFHSILSFSDLTKCDAPEQVIFH